VNLPKVTKITVITDRSGPDTVYLTFDLPPATHPFESPNNKPYAKVQIAAGGGADWVRNVFGCEPQEVIHT